MDVYSVRFFLFITCLVLVSAWIWLTLRSRSNQNKEVNKIPPVWNEDRSNLFNDNPPEPNIRDLEVQAEPSPENGQNLNPNTNQSTNPNTNQSTNQGINQPPQDDTSFGQVRSFLGKLLGNEEDELSLDNGVKEQQDKLADEQVKIISIKLYAKKREGFKGETLLSMFERYNLVFGKMDVFHRKIGVQGEEKESFSVMNNNEPGTLVPEQLKDTHTHSLRFYIILNSCYNPLGAFNEMLEVANNFATIMDGELKDSGDCSLSPQIIEYHRDNIKEFMHKSRVAKMSVND